MIQQGILPFKIEHTEEQITPRSGLALFAEVMRALDVRRKVEGHFPKPGSNRGYQAWSYIEPVLLMLEGGGHHIEDLREIRDDAALRQLVGIGEMPSLSTYGDWLVRASRSGWSSNVGGIRNFRSFKNRSPAIMSSPRTGMTGVRKRSSGFITSADRPKTRSWSFAWRPPGRSANFISGFGLALRPLFDAEITSFSSSPLHGESYQGRPNRNP